MERYVKTLRGWIEKLTQAVRRRSASLWAGIQARMGEIPPRRIAASVVALSLLTIAGGMDASERATKPRQEVFGAVHWYEG